MADKPLEDQFYSKNMYTTETRRKGIIVSKVGGGNLNITEATLTVYDAIDDRELIAAVNCTIDNNTGYVYAYVPAGENIGKRYAMVYYKDGSHLGKVRLDYEIIR